MKFEGAQRHVEGYSVVRVHSVERTLIEIALPECRAHPVWGDTAGPTVGGTGSGAPQSIPVFGRVPAQGPKPEGSYQDTITATVTF